jgi:two-component system, OmpR family, sensor histidine kinase MprB
MTFRTRLVLASTVAVVVAVLAASSASYLAARNTLLNAADNSLQAAANKLNAGQNIDTTNATLGQIVDSTGAVVTGGDLPVTAQVRLVAAGLAPAFFSTVDVNGNELRELVEPLAEGTPIEGQPLTEGGALQIATLLNEGPILRKLGLVLGGVALIGVMLAVLFGWLVARTALVPLYSLTATVEELAESTDVTHRLSPGGPDELGRLRRTFNRLLEALESSRRAQSQLVLDASHELRTPLTSLRTNLEVIRRVDELSLTDRSILVDDVLVQLQELTDLVGDMAELARGDQLPVLKETIRLDELVADAVALAVTHGRAQDVAFTLESQECWVDANVDRLDRAIGNLLDNARKYSRPGQSVSVWCRQGEVVVEDHGPGIAPEDLPHIFDRFYRSPAARSEPGSGLGLAIVAQVAKSEGGTITAAAAQGGGTRMTLRIPVVAPPADQDDEPIAPPSQAVQTASMSSMRLPKGSST